MHLLLFILLYFTDHVFAQQPPVDCLVVNLDNVRCTWNGQKVPHGNYTFSSRFHDDPEFIECATYILKNSSVIGCQQPFEELGRKRFNTFYTRLEHGNYSFEQNHEDLKSKVKMNPPVNLSVKNGTDSNLWFYWNSSHSLNCEESQIRYRTGQDYNKWETNILARGKKSFTINLPNSNTRYKLQVCIRIHSSCGESIMWSDWSQPVFWGSINNSTNSRLRRSMSLQTLVLSITGAFVFIIAFIIWMQHERIRIILVPIIPNAGKNLDKILIDGNVEDWLHISKGLKEGFKANFNERACPVREYNRLPQSASESSDCSNSSVNTDQTNYSISIPADESECLSTSCCSSTSTLPVLSEEEQINV